MKTSSTHGACIALNLALLAGAVPGFAQAARLPGPGSYGAKIEVRTDLAFGENEQQKLDLYLPADADSAPVVICWFGGAFWGSDKYAMSEVCAFLAARGYAAVAPNYFLGKRNGAVAAWPQAVYDAKAAVRYVRANAKALHLDPNRVAALGYSSGAYLAAMVGFTPNLTELEGTGGDRAESSRVSAVVAISGVYDRRGTLGLPLALLGQGYEKKHDLRVATSPVLYVGPDTVPVYILHGDHDHVANVASARQLAAALEDAHVPHQLRIVDADHDPVNAAELAAVAGWLDQVFQFQRKP